jgi:hypothetical protein
MKNGTNRPLVNRHPEPVRPPSIPSWPPPLPSKPQPGPSVNFARRFVESLADPAVRWRVASALTPPGVARDDPRREKIRDPAGGKSCGVSNKHPGPYVAARGQACTNLLHERSVPVHILESRAPAVKAGGPVLLRREGAGEGRS